MKRSKWKGLYIDLKMRNFNNLKKTETTKHAVIHRNSSIIPKFIGLTLKVHTGNSFKNVIVKENMVGHKFGEFAKTRQEFVFKKKKRKKKNKMKSWKLKYFEKNTKESHVYIFSSLEIKNYIRKLLSNYGFTLNKYQISFSNSTVHIFISIFDTEYTTTTLSNREQKFNKTKRQNKKEKKVYGKRTELNTHKNLKLNDFSGKLVEGIKLFLKKKYNIVLTIQKLSSELTQNQTKANLENIQLKLRRFDKSKFFTQGVPTIFTFISKPNSEQLLTKFISKELAATKRHKFFLSFLKESLLIMINQNFSKIAGVKLIVKGRLNNVMRASSYVIQIGKISLITKSPNLTYSEKTAYGKNGTLGIKLWVLKKF